MGRLEDAERVNKWFIILNVCTVCTKVKKSKAEILGVISKNYNASKKYNRPFKHVKIAFNLNK
ncbi:hypothetical protein CW732_08315 [Olleya sp. Bg11-27]|nr:hypothetical protein CW732_08315 [Olleya sp. Bg11-27]